MIDQHCEAFAMVEAVELAHEIVGGHGHGRDFGMKAADQFTPRLLTFSDMIGPWDPRE
ncbi:MAG TPA: hypothetical protein VM869_13485 [Enhygromyxa sp.]|nr:hypothetical protein [Enhygromyxa sp.]